MLSSREEDYNGRNVKARSASIEILDDSILAQDFDVGSCNSTLERKKLAKSVGSPKISGPRICKPGDSPTHQQLDAEAEVADFDVERMLVREEYVLGLDVAMNYVVRVHVVHGGRYLTEERLALVFA